MALTERMASTSPGPVLAGGPGSAVTPFVFGSVNFTYERYSIEIVNHYVMMGIGQVVVLRLPPSHVRRVNRAIEYGAWGSFETEFYLTYGLRAARAGEAAAER